MAEPKGSGQDDLYQGSAASKYLGLLSFLALGYALLELILFRWWVALAMFTGSIVIAYVAYRLAGGRGNATLLKASWQGKQHIDVVGESCGDWQQKIKLMFEALEEDADGDYSLAIRRLHVKDSPKEVHAALTQAEAMPTAENWNRLREAMLRNPPLGA